MKLNDKQQEISSLLKSKYGIITWIAERRQGKTLTVCTTAIDSCLEKPNSKSILITYDRQLKYVMQPMVDQLIAELDEVPEFKATERCYVFKNGSRLYLKNDINAECFRGTRFDFIGVDEAAQVRDLEYLIYSILAPSIMTSGGRIALTSTIENTKNDEFNRIVISSLLDGNLINTININNS